MGTIELSTLSGVERGRWRADSETRIFGSRQVARAFPSERGRRRRAGSACEAKVLDASPTPLSPPSTATQALVPQQIEMDAFLGILGAVLSANRCIVKAGGLGRGSLCCCERRRRRRVKRPPLSASHTLLSTSVPVPSAPSQTLKPPPNDEARSLERIGTGREVNSRLENPRLREHHP